LILDGSSLLLCNIFVQLPLSAWIVTAGIFFLMNEAESDLALSNRARAKGTFIFSARAAVKSTSFSLEMLSRVCGAPIPRLSTLISIPRPALS
jgi:hypothetical protein